MNSREHVIYSLLRMTSSEAIASSVFSFFALVILCFHSWLAVSAFAERDLIAAAVPFKTSSQTNKEIVSDVKRGILSPDLVEILRVVSPNSAEGAEFQKLVSEVATQIYPNHNFEREPIQFLLVDEQAPNAFYIKHSKRPAYIGLTKGLLRAITNRDQLAGIVSHELNHYFIAQRLGEGTNTKIEETAADVASVRDLIVAGMDPTQVLKLHQEILVPDADADRLASTWRDILDVHPSRPVRIRAIELGLAEMHQQRGPLRKTPAPLDSRFTTLIDRAHRDSFVNRELLRLGFYENSSDTQRKAQILSTVISQLPHWNKVREADVDWAVRTLISADQKIILGEGGNPWPQSSPTWDAVNGLANAILDIDKRSELKSRSARSDLGYLASRLYLSLVEPAPNTRYQGTVSNAGSGLEREYWKPIAIPALGRIAELKQLLARFMHSRSFEEAEMLANEIQVRLSTFHTQGEWVLLELPDWPIFDMPKIKEGMASHELPWDKLVQYALRDPSHQIGKVLFTFGVHDRRLFKEDLTLDILLNSEVWQDRLARNPGVWIGPNEKGETIVDLEIENDQVHLIAPEQRRMQNLQSAIDLPKIISELLDRAYRGDATADAKLRALVKKRQFSQLSFSHKARSIIGSEDHFAWDPKLLLRLNAAIGPSAEIDRPLTKTFKSLLAKDPSKYASTIKEFFLHGKGSLEYWKATRRKGFKVPLNSPLATFILEDTHKIFSDEEKRQFIAESTEYDWLRGMKVDAKPLETIRSLFNLPAARNWDDAYAAVATAKSSPHQIARDLAFLDVKNLLTRTNGKGLDLSRLLPNLDKKVVRQNSRQYEGNFVSDLRKAVDTHPEYFEGDNKKALENWAVSARFGALPSNETVRGRRTREFLDWISQLASPELQVEYYEKLLIEARIEDPSQRKRATAQWADAMRRLHGLDDDSKSYFRAMKRAIHRVSRRADVGTRYQMLHDLADAVQSQERLSESLRRSTIDISRDHLVRSHVPFIVSEYILSQLRGEKVLAMELAKYLSGPNDAQAQSKLVEVLKQSKNWKFQVVGMGITLKDDLIKEHLDTFHREFWSQPLEWRAAIADLILRPPSLRDSDPVERDKRFLERFNFVMNEILPQNSTHQNEIREHLLAYLSVAEEYQRGPYLAAVMAASKRAGAEGREATLGDFIGTVLDNMGPAEKKAEQAIHSYPGTPEEIRQGTEKSKFMAGLMSRWEIWRMARNLPPNIRKQIARVNHVEGAASFWVVMNVTLKPESELAKLNGSTEAALGLLRPFSDEKVADGFEKARAYIQKLSDPTVRKHLTFIVEEAEKLAKVELDPTLTLRHFEKSNELYTGTKVAIEGHLLHFGSIRLLGNAYGKDFRMMSLAKGTNFNSLPTDTENEIATKRRWAIAHTFVEMAFLFSGLESDVDPHGGNGRVEVMMERLTRLDPGGIALNRPKSEDLRLLGEALYHAVAEANGDSEKIKQTLVSNLTKTQEAHPNHRDFLLRAQQTFLALQDDWRHFQPGDIEQIFQSLYHGKLIDRNVVAGFVGGPLTALSRIQHIGSFVRRGSPCDDALIELFTAEGHPLSSVTRRAP